MNESTFINGLEYKLTSLMTSAVAVVSTNHDVVLPRNTWWARKVKPTFWGASTACSQKNKANYFSAQRHQTATKRSNSGSAI